MTLKTNSCPECGQDEIGSFSLDNVFGFGGLVDEHMDTDISEEELSKRLTEAYEMAKRLGGTIPGGYQDDLNTLLQPKLAWQDFYRFRKKAKKDGNTKNNWNAPKKKALFSGLYIPKKVDYNFTFVCAIDMSGSMTNENITFGISQLQALNGYGSGYVVGFDAGCFWGSKLKIEKSNFAELSKIKRQGGGGTILLPFFQEYEKEVGKVDMLIVISDFYLADKHAVEALSRPKNIDVMWLNVNGNPHFKYPFGRPFQLYNE